MRRPLRNIAFVLVATALHTVPASAQSVADVVDQMYAAYESQSAGIDNYTVVQSMMGFESTSYFEKETIDGRPIFRLQSSNMQGGGGPTVSLGGEDMGQGDVYLFGPELVEHGRYAGREQIDGNEVHVIAVDDLSALDLSQPMQADEMQFEPTSGRIYVDAQLGFPRRMSFSGQANVQGQMNDVTATIDLLDIRNVDGMYFPYRTSMSIEGIGAMIDPEMRAQLEEMEEQLANLPPQQREMMERMMGGQLEQLRSMMSGDSDALSFEMTVSEVRVNTGPPNE